MRRGHVLDLWDGTTPIGCPLPFEADFARDGGVLQASAHEVSDVRSGTPGFAKAPEDEALALELALLLLALAPAGVGLLFPTAPSTPDTEPSDDFVRPRDLDDDSTCPNVTACPYDENIDDCVAPPVDGPRDCTTVGLDLAQADLAFHYAYDDASDAPGSDDANLILSAWAFLQDNVDVIQWVACLLGGDLVGLDPDPLVLNELPGCLSDRVMGTGMDEPTVALRAKADIHGSPFFTHTIFGAGHVEIAGHGYEWETYYSKPYAVSVPGSPEQFCVVVDLAATLLHELLHTCLLTLGDSGCQCHLSYLIENSFRAALYQRYPCLGTTRGCCYYADPCLWMNSCASWYSSPPKGVVVC